MDVLSDVLRVVRLKGALFLHAEFHEPWCVDAPRGADLAQVLAPGARQLAICHLVVEGRCWIRLRDGGEPVALQAGDVAAMPHGDSHWIGSGRRHGPMHVDDGVQLQLPELSRVRYGGDGDPCIVVCGWFACERNLADPLTARLPRLFTVSLRSRPAGAWLEQSVRYAVSEAAVARPGSEAVAAKVAELLFLETLRGHIESLPPGQTGWLAGVRDPSVGRCLALMHEQPARAWTVAELAEAVHVSRTVLALRFTELVGMPPMQYLKRWRLALAADLLRSDGSNLLRVAGDIGYESEAAFNRAFKREYGMPPGQWRRGEGGASVPTANGG